MKTVMSHSDTQLSNRTLTSKSVVPLAANTWLHAEIFNSVEAKLSLCAEMNLGLILQEENSVQPLQLNFVHFLPPVCFLFLIRRVPSRLKLWNPRINCQLPPIKYSCSLLYQLQSQFLCSISCIYKSAKRFTWFKNSWSSLCFWSKTQCEKGEY